MAKLTLTDLSTLVGGAAVTTLNNNFAAIEEAIENTYSRDGTSPNTMEDNLDMNSFRIQNLVAAVGDTEPVRKAEFDSGLTDLEDTVTAIAAAASVSANEAATSAALAATLYDDFSDLYLGAKANDPSTDNDGDALTTGDLYFNTTDDVMRVWNGAAWQDSVGSSSPSATDLDSLTDVVITAAATGDILRFNGTNWVDYPDSNFQAADADLTALAGGTLQNVSSIDATTESTIETAIDTLANLTSIQGQTVTLADAGANAFFGWDDVAGAYENLTAAEAEAIIEPLIDTLDNLTSIQGKTVTLADAGANAFFGWDDTAGAYENLTAAEAEAIIEPLIDTLANLTSIQGVTVAYADEALDVLWGWDDSAGTYKNMTNAVIATEASPAAGDFVLLMGAEGDLRKVNWSGLPGAGGGVNGPVSSTDNALARWDGAGGDTLQDSVAILDDTGNLVTDSGTALAWKMRKTGADAAGHALEFYKTRGADASTQTILTTGDDVGYITWYASDGVAYRSIGQLYVDVDPNLTIGASDTPGRMVLQTAADATAGTLKDRMVLYGNDNTFIDILSDDAGATQGPTLRLNRQSASVAANDVIGGLEFAGRDDAGGTATYAQIVGKIESPVNGSEDGILLLYARVNDSLVEQMRLDSAGVTLTTLNGVTGIDATTESTIESAIDTLANLTSVQGLTVTLADAGADAIFGWDDSAAAYENLTQGEVRAIAGLATTDSPEFTALNVGHASDSTITRVSAGTLAIEGSNILTAATGQPLDELLTEIAALSTDPNADSGFFFDDSAGNVAYWTPANGLEFSGTNLQMTSSLRTATITFIIDGGGATITTGVKGYLEIPFACTIDRATLLADQSGSIVIDIWKDTYANYPPVDADSITAAAPPTISSATKSQDSTLTGWTTSISAGDILGFNVDSITTCQRVTLSLRVNRT